MSKKMKLRFLPALLLIAAVLLCSGCSFSWESEDQPVLVVTGDGLVEDETDPASLANERAYSLAELAALPQTEQVYSTFNTGEFRKQAIASGVAVDDLLAASGFDSDRDDDAKADFTFASGDYGKEFPKLFSTALFRYPNQMAGDFDTKEYTRPLIALSFAISGDNTDEVPASDALEALELPMLTVGAQDPDDMNNSSFIKELDTVCVGNPLSAVTTVFGNELSRAQLLRLPRVTYTYGGTTYRGVAVYSLFQLLAEADEATGELIVPELDPEEIISFNLADGSQLQYPVKDITDGAKMMMLATECRGEDGEWQAVPGNALCSSAEVVPGVVSVVAGVDYSHSPFKHVTYEGGDEEDIYAPDAITGATLTVEGPGVTATTPIMVSDLEKTANANIRRGSYSDDKGGGETTQLYEGVTILSILDGQVNSGVELSDEPENIQVVFKNRWRQPVAVITYDQLLKADKDGSPVLLAYGTAPESGDPARPFVYDNEPGYIEELDNDDGGLRLVYPSDTAENLPAEFGSVAYIYVEYVSPQPGFKHTEAADEAYNNPENTEYIVTLTGSALGREVDLTVAELEAMVDLDENGQPKADGLGYRSEYGLSNTTYWYVNTYEGVKLWDLLTRLGLDAEKYQNDDNTIVSFSSWDNYRTTAAFTTRQLAHPELFYFYEKSPLDIGTDRPTREQLSTAEYQPDNSNVTETDANGYPALSGYPVMISYGVNGYPYVKSADMEGYESGLGNDGGPVRVIFGKTDNMNRDNPEDITNYAYFYNNGSNQLQRAMEIYVGDEVRYSTHYQNPAYQAMADAPALTVEVVQENGSRESKSYTLTQLEQLIYGVDKVTRDNEGRREKAYYQYDKDIDALFEGVNLWWLLSEDIGLPGALGKVELYAGDALSATTDLEALKSEGGNELRGTSGLSAAVAYARGGYPLVSNASQSGYLAQDSVTGLKVDNAGGPLAFVAPAYAGGGYSYVPGLTRIVVKLEPDAYAHTGGYASLAGNVVSFDGDVGAASSLTVGDIEKLQKYMVTAQYDGKTYRGVDLLQLLNDNRIQASSTMETITCANAKGESAELQLTDINAAEPRVILAYGVGTDDSDRNAGCPLVPAASSEGYDEKAGNAGGPLMLIGPGVKLENVSAVTVKAAEISGWYHTYGYYAKYLDEPVLRVTGSGVADPVTFTLGQLESLNTEMVLDTYKVVNDIWFQGVDLNKLLHNYVELTDENIGSFTAYASDGYSTLFDGSYLKDGINGKPMIVAYGQGIGAADGLPLVDGNDGDKISDGFDPVYGNAFGPVRLIVNDNTGWCVKWMSCIVIGSGAMEDPADFADDLSDLPTTVGK